MVNIRVRSLPATRVGVYTQNQTYREQCKVPCARCGIERTIRPNRVHGDLCQDCLLTDRHFGTQERA